MSAMPRPSQLRLVRAQVHEVTWQLEGVGAARRLGAHERRGALLHLTWDLDGKPVHGLGEAAPLPGDDADAQLAALPQVARALAEPSRAPADDGPGEPEACAALARALAEPWPAVRFALETALLSGLAQRRGVALAQLLHASPAPSVPVNAVVATVEEAAAAWARGIRCFKVKLGADTAADARTLHALRSRFPRARLRGDVNRGWPADEVRARLQALAPAGLEYVEEPCADLATALARGEPWPVPVALDESALALPTRDLTEALRSPQVAALVMKPTCAGGLSACRALAALAARAGKPAVVTHALEGPVAFAACAELARALAPSQPGSAALAVGLHHHPGLVAWSVTAPQLGRGEVVAAQEAGLGLELRWGELLPRPPTEEASR